MAEAPGSARRHRDPATDSLTPWIVLALFVVVVFLLLRAPRVGARGALATGDPRWGPGAARQTAERDYFWSNLLSFILGMLANSGRRAAAAAGAVGRRLWRGFSGGGGSSGGGGASGSW